MTRHGCAQPTRSTESIYGGAICAVLKQVHPDTAMSRKSLLAVDDMIHEALRLELLRLESSQLFN